MARYRPGPALSPNYDDDEEDEEEDEEERGEGKREREQGRLRATCTYVSVNDEDYRSFLAAEEKLKASLLRAAFPPLPRPMARDLRGAHERTDATWIHYSLQILAAAAAAGGRDSLNTKREGVHERTHTHACTQVQPDKSGQWELQRDCFKSHSYASRETKIYRFWTGVVAAIGLNATVKYFTTRRIIAAKRRL